MENVNIENDMENEEVREAIDQINLVEKEGNSKSGYYYRTETQTMLVKADEHEVPEIPAQKISTGDGGSGGTLVKVAAGGVIIYLVGKCIGWLYKKMNKPSSKDEFEEGARNFEQK